MDGRSGRDGTCGILLVVVGWNPEDQTPLLVPCGDY